jgi:hypothetical protein
MSVKLSWNAGDLRYLPSLGAVVPGRIEAIATTDEWSATIVVAIEDGTTVVDEVSLHRVPGGPPILAETLRSVRVASIARHAVEVAAMPARRENGRLRMSVLGPDAETLDAEAVAAVLPPPRKRRPASEHQERLEAVVKAYRTACSDPKVTAPRRTVGRELGYSPGTIGKMLHEARAAGLLGAARPGRAGEIESPVEKGKHR